MAQENIKKLNYCQKYIVNEGTADERHYDSINEHYIVPSGCRHGFNVYVADDSEESSLLRADGSIIISSNEFLYCHPLDFSDRFICMKRKKNNDEGEAKTGVVDLKNQVIFPFSHESLLFHWDMDIIEAIGLIAFGDTVDDESKVGLTRWPSDEVIFEPQWDTIISRVDPTHVENGFLLCCKDEAEYWDDYRLNIIRLSDLKLLFEKCRYLRMTYAPDKEYNIGVVDYKRTRLLAYEGVHFEVFDPDGKVLLSKKCYDFINLSYENVFLAQNVGKMDWGRNSTLFILYKDEQGKEKVFQKRFNWTEEHYYEAVEKAEAFLETPDIKKLLGKKLDDSQT